LEPLVDDGVDFWVNDEGEADYFMFHWWNVAEALALPFTEGGQRFYSLNRAWTPGMARLGATVWTGEIDATWEDLMSTPGMMLNWVLAGAPYVACDIGGFKRDTTAELLTRWMQVGIFMPTMRVHSGLQAVPHWPWLWGDEASGAMRQALELRYRLIPYHYSLAHTMFTSLFLWMRPLVMEFPDDPVAADITTEWMDGAILVAPILHQHSRRQIYLPAGTWYPLGASKITRTPVSCERCRRTILEAPGRQGNALEIVHGPAHMGGEAAFDEVPAFVRAGTVLPLAPVVQHTGALPGGALEVQVYAGADGSFDLFEDDGETTKYQSGHLRITRFHWDDATGTLSWRLTGSVLAPGQIAFRELFVSLFDEAGAVRRSATEPLGMQGSISTDALFA